MRKNYICINPYHYGYEENAADPSDHDCHQNLCVQASGGGIKTICRQCRKNVIENITSNNFFTPDDPGGDASKSPKKKDVAPAEIVKVKQEPPENNEAEAEVEEDDLEQLDKDFQGMLDSIEDAVVKEEIREAGGEFDDNPLSLLDTILGESDSDTNDAENLEEDIIDNRKRIEIVPAPKQSRKRTASDLDNGEDDESSSPAKRRAEPPPDKPFHCWQCLVWFANRVDLRKHSCLKELSMTAEVMFICHFCGCCSSSLDGLRPHVATCKSFNLAPLKCFLKFEPATTSVLVAKEKKSTLEAKGGDPVTPTRSTRSRRSDKHEAAASSKCDRCEVVFASKAELISHNTKVKCKSHQCDSCQKYFATDRSLAGHTCEGPADENAISGAPPKIDQVDQTRTSR